MKQFELHRTYRKKDLCALVLCLPAGIHVSLYGGDLPHIGAVGIVDVDGSCSVVEFPCHREGVLCERWIAALANAGFCPAVVEAGIHYDNLDKYGIRTVMELMDEMLCDVLSALAIHPV